MIGKQEKGRSFRNCLRYVLEKEGAQFLGGNMLGESINELASEFEAICRLNPRLDVAVYHAMLSVSAEERRTDEQWRAIAASYMRGMEFDNSQYVIVRHTDEEHDHVHIVASRVAIPDGKAVSDSNDYRRSEDLIRDLERTYELQPVVSSYEQLDRAPTTGEVRKFEKQYQQYTQGIRANPPEPPIRLALQTIVSQLSQDELTMPELVEQLQERGVEVRVSLTEKQQWGISYSLSGQKFSGTQLGRAYTFQGLQKHKGIDYEPERDDARISAAVCGQSRTSAQSTANCAANDNSDSSDRGLDSRTEVAETAIWGINFVPSTFARENNDFREESAEFTAEFEELFEAIEGYSEQEAINAIAGAVGEFSERFEQSCREPRTTEGVRQRIEGVRQGIEEVDRQLGTYFEQLSLELETPTVSVLDDETTQWYEQVQRWSNLYNQYTFYGEGASSSEQEDLAIAQAAFDDELSNDEVFRVVACGDQADSLVQSHGVAEASAYTNRLMENARFQLQLLLLQQQGYGLPQISKKRQQRYYNQSPDQTDETHSDLAIAQDVYRESKNWDEAMAVVGAGHSARRIAYQRGAQAWVDYVNETITQAHSHLTDQAEDSSASVIEDDEIELSCDWGQRQWVARPEQIQQLQKAIQRSQRELSIAHQAKTVLDEELKVASQANLLERMFQDKEDLKHKRAKSERIGTRIYGLQSELKQSQSTLDYYQSSIRSEENRLETVYTALVQEVQDKLTLQDPRAIDQRIALEILRASPQPEEDLNALNFSSQIQSIRSIAGEKDQSQVYLDEIIESARGRYQRFQVLEALQSWEVAAMALQRPYSGQITEIVEDFKQGKLFSNEVKEAAREDLTIYLSPVNYIGSFRASISFSFLLQN
ncbi:relaxase/mobilization nuclease domain-containing protein [Pseudanabaenaceae cyanobacterium LEGE 13415]|nr:relaxase/mobilization nuclease domain-containing protein [Pseudanabaenaceae cyanobacterium LEGE 13415]